MKYCLFLVMILYGGSIYHLKSAEKPFNEYITFSNLPQQEPFYFNKPIPSKIIILDKVDLSFFRNPLITSYRYRLEIPAGVETTINKRILIWSSWSENDFADIVVPRLDIEGRYKLLIEYKTRGGSETKKLEKVFSVYRLNSPANPVTTKSGTANVPGKAQAKTTITTEKQSARTTGVIEKPAVKTVPLTDKSPPKTTTATEKAPERISPVTNAAITLTAPATDKPPINTVTTMNQATEKDTTEPATVKKNTNPDYEKLVSEAIEKKDSALINKAVQNGAGKTIKGIYGGNLFHILDHTLASEDFILLLKRKGFSIDESDDYGNSPLHFAILTGRNDYARSLINQGADINIKNRSDLSPLHLAVLLNNTGLVKDLLRRGAELNQKGKNGYTPLHIASELNYAEAALNLLNSGAEIRIKTDQKLTPKAIAKIQKNTDIVKLIRNKNSFDPNLLGLASSRIFSQINNDGTKYPDIRFDLAFDKKLSQKRQFNKFIQILSIPVIVISAGSTAYLRSEANHYYSLSKIAETEAMGKVYYDKTRQYDRYTYIAGGVSIVSIYGFIHSTIRKKNISNKMHKTLY